MAIQRGGDTHLSLNLWRPERADSAAGVIGVRANYSFDYEWGRLAPGVKAEYAHDFRGSSRARMGYSVLGGLPMHSIRTGRPQTVPMPA